MGRLSIKKRKQNNQLKNNKNGKINYSELLNPVIEKIGKDIEADKRGCDEPSNVLLVLSAQISTKEDGDDEIHTSMIGNGTMLTFLLME